MRPADLSSSSPAPTAGRHQHTGDHSAIWDAGPNPLALSDLEIASGLVYNLDQGIPRLGPGREHPLEALEAVLRPMLERGPLVVAFSGGRDSSVLLAAAVRVARREGLDPPIPLTARWAGDRDSDEREWQEMVIRSLELSDWNQFDPGIELDLLGPVARAALSRFGLFWPAPAYVMIPLLRAARGGTLISGEGGDQVFAWWRLAPVRSAWRARRRPSIGMLRAVAATAVPLPVRRRIGLRSADSYQDWLSDDGRRLAQLALAEEWALHPVSWRWYLARQTLIRENRLTIGTLERFAETEGARFAAPLLNPRFLAALGRFGGHASLGDRMESLTAVFDGILPPAVLGRSTKAAFGTVFWGPESRRFAEQWTGAGIPAHLIDPESLRAAWLRDVPVYAAALPLQAAWLASEPGRSATAGA